MTAAPRVLLTPGTPPATLVDAVGEAGGTVTEDPRDADLVVWLAPTDPTGMPEVLAAAPGVPVQLPFAGIEPFLPHIDGTRPWYCGKGVYAEPVAELALALLLAGMRGVVAYAREDGWSRPRGENLLGARVTLVGGGEISVALARLLQPFGTRLTVVRRRADAPFPGAAAVLPPERLDEAVDGADAVVLALALAPGTRGIVDRRILAAMGPQAWLVNVARGAHVVTDDLVDALEAGRIGGAALDVTDPEPLPPDHALWRLPNCIITPHVGNTPEMAVPLLATRTRENVRRLAAGAELLGRVDPEAGY